MGLWYHIIHLQYCFNVSIISIEDNCKYKIIVIATKSWIVNHIEFFMQTATKRKHHRRIQFQIWIQNRDTPSVTCSYPVLLLQRSMCVPLFFSVKTDVSIPNSVGTGFHSTDTGLHLRWSDKDLIIFIQIWTHYFQIIKQSSVFFVL